MRVPFGQSLVCSLGFFLGGAGLASAAEDALDVRQLEVPPALVQSVVPEYPVRHRKTGTEGFVSLEFIVLRDGRVGPMQVLQATHGEFALAVTDAVQRWRFNPGRIKGRAVNTRVLQQFPFTLNDDPKQLRFTVLGAAGGGVACDTPPKPVNRDSPAIYPTDELLRSEEGKVILEFIIGIDGRARDGTVRETTNPAFAQAAAAAVNETLFSPAQAKGKPVAVRATAEFRFKADGTGDVELPTSTKTLLAELRADAALVQPVPPRVRPRPWMANGPLFPRLWASTPPQGEATVEILIDRQGRAQLPKVIACTAPEFGAAAARAVAAWRFFPIQADGKPIVTRVQVPFGFDRTKGDGFVR